MRCMRRTNIHGRVEWARACARSSHLALTSLDSKSGGYLDLACHRRRGERGREIRSFADSKTGWDSTTRLPKLGFRNWFNRLWCQRSASAAISLVFLAGVTLAAGKNPF